MRTIQRILFCAALGGCSSSIPRLPEAALSAARPADQFVGKDSILSGPAGTNVQLHVRNAAGERDTTIKLGDYV